MKRYRWLVIACLALVSVAAMYGGSTLVGSKWSSGHLLFYDVGTGSTILEIKDGNDGVGVVDLAVSDDVLVGDDLVVTGLATVGETFVVTGASTLSGGATLGAALDLGQESVTTDTALSVFAASTLDSSGSTLTLTLADGTVTGQSKLITSSAAGNNADVTIAHHETADSEVLRFDAADEYALLVWAGTEWATVSMTSTAP